MISGAILPWRYAILSLMFLPLICFVLLLFCPESPSWLLSKGNEIEARKSLQKLRGANHEKMIESELFRISSNLSNRQGHIFLRAQAYSLSTSARLILIIQYLWQKYLGHTHLGGRGNILHTSKRKKEYMALVTDNPIPNQKLNLSRIL